MSLTTMSAEPSKLQKCDSWFMCSHPLRVEKHSTWTWPLHISVCTLAAASQLTQNLKSMHLVWQCIQISTVQRSYLAAQSTSILNDYLTQLVIFALTNKLVWWLNILLSYSFFKLSISSTVIGNNVDNISICQQSLQHHITVTIHILLVFNQIMALLLFFFGRAVILPYIVQLRW